MPSPSESVAPHDFRAFRRRDGWRPDGRCRHCYLPKRMHPVGEWTEARPLNDKRAAVADLPCVLCERVTCDGGCFEGSDALQSENVRLRASLTRITEYVETCLDGGRHGALERIGGMAATALADDGVDPLDPCMSCDGRDGNHKPECYFA